MRSPEYDNWGGAVVDADRPGLAQREGQAETSKLAAARILPRTGTARRRVYDAIVLSAFGLTDEQIQFQLRMNPNTQRPRRVELVNGGFIRDSGRRRQTLSGDRAVIWEVQP